MGERGGGLEPGGGSRGASFGGLGIRAMFSLILVCKSPLGRCNVKASLSCCRVLCQRAGGLCYKLLHPSEKPAVDSLTGLFVLGHSVP